MFGIIYQNPLTYNKTKFADQENARENTLSNDSQMNRKKNTFLPHETSAFMKKNDKI